MCFYGNILFSHLCTLTLSPLRAEAFTYLQHYHLQLLSLAPFLIEWKIQMVHVNKPQLAMCRVNFAIAIQNFAIAFENLITVSLLLAF